MKRKLFFMCLFLTSVLAVKAQDVELIKNGNFEDGTNGWNLGREFSRKGSTGNFYVETGDNLNQYKSPRLKTDGQTFGIAKGKKYTISYYVKGSNFNPQKLTVNFSMTDKDGNPIYNKPSKEGDVLTSLKLTKIRDEGGWEYYEKEFTFDDSVVFVKEIGFSITGTGEEKSNKAIKNISFKGEKVEVLPAPKNLRTEVFQREILLTWDGVQGYDKYAVKVGDRAPVEVTGTSYMVTGLEIDEQYSFSVSVSSSGNGIAFPTIKKEFTAQSDYYDEADRIPYILLDNVSNPFFVHVYDTNKPLTVNSVMVNGQVINANADGTYTLPTGANKTLKFFFSDTEGQKWEFEYKGVTVN